MRTFCDTYQIAHEDLAIASGRGLGGNWFGRGASGWLRVLLNATDNGTSRLWTVGPSLGCTAVAGRLALGRDDVVKGLVELAGHDGQSLQE